MVSNLQDYLIELTSGDDKRAELAASKIAVLPAGNIPEALSALGSFLTSPDADVRWWATRALAGIGDARVPNLLLKALGDEDATVRQCAALGLRLHPSQSSVPALVVALTDEDHLVAKLSGDALVHIGEPAVPALLETMQKENKAAQLEAVRALAKIGDERSVEALFEALDGDSALVDYWAREGLERMGVGMVFFKPD